MPTRTGDQPRAIRARRGRLGILGRPGVHRRFELARLFALLAFAFHRRGRRRRRGQRRVHRGWRRRWRRVLGLHPGQRLRLGGANRRTAGEAELDPARQLGIGQHPLHRPHLLAAAQVQVGADALHPLHDARGVDAIGPEAVAVVVRGALATRPIAHRQHRSRRIGDHGAHVVDVVALGHPVLQKVIADDPHHAFAAGADPHARAAIAGHRGHRRPRRVVLPLPIVQAGQSVAASDPGVLAIAARDDPGHQIADRRLGIVGPRAAKEPRHSLGRRHPHAALLIERQRRNPIRRQPINRRQHRRRRRIRSRRPADEAARRADPDQARCRGETVHRPRVREAAHPHRRGGRVACRPRLHLRLRRRPAADAKGTECHRQRAGAQHEPGRAEQPFPKELFRTVSGHGPLPWWPRASCSAVFAALLWAGSSHIQHLRCDAQSTHCCGVCLYLIAQHAGCP